MNALKSGLAAALITLVISSCSKNETVAPLYCNAEKTNDIEVPTGFDWTTSKNISVSIKPQQKGMLLIVDDKGTVYTRAYLKTGKPFTAKIATPGYTKKLFLYFRGQEEEIQLSSAYHVSKLK